MTDPAPPLKFALGIIVGGKICLCQLEESLGGRNPTYRARHVETERQVVIKGLSLSFPFFIRREAYAMSHLPRGHPNLVLPEEGFVLDGFHCFIFPLVHGENAYRRIMRRQRFFASEAKTVVDGICDALETVHQAGIVHRDIKPENILLAYAPLPNGGTTHPRFCAISTYHTILLSPTMSRRTRRWDRLHSWHRRCSSQSG